MNKKEIIELLNKNNIKVPETDIDFLENLSKLDDEQLDLVEKMINELRKK